MNCYGLVSRVLRGRQGIFLALALLVPFTGRGAEIIINEIMAQSID